MEEVKDGIQWEDDVTVVSFRETKQHNIANFTTVKKTDKPKMVINFLPQTREKMHQP